MKNRNKAPENRIGQKAQIGVPALLIVTLLILLSPANLLAEPVPADQETPVPSFFIGTDPFLPFIEPPRDEKPDGAVPGTAPSRPGEPAFRTPLQRLTLQEIRLLGIVIGGDSKLAVVRDGKGIVHDLFEGTAVGMNEGRVLEIQQDRVIIEETVRDPEGVTQRQTVLKIE